jgi:hypothetical protein
MAAMTALLQLLNDQKLRLVHEDVAYAPIAGDAALGALLFALRLDEPGAVGFEGARVAERPELHLALATARQFAHALRRHAGRTERGMPALPGVVSENEARGWLLAAAEAVPAAEQERFCWRVARRLGPAPWADGSAAIELRHQQFGLFGEAFEAMEAAEAAATATAAAAAAEAAATATAAAAEAAPAPAGDSGPAPAVAAADEAPAAAVDLPAGTAAAVPAAPSGGADDPAAAA